MKLLGYTGILEIMVSNCLSSVIRLPVFPNCFLNFTEMTVVLIVLRHERNSGQNLRRQG